MSDTLDIVVVGAGVVGLSIAKYLSEINNRVLVIEKNNDIGKETSSRNSEVIHAGIYYPENSLKTKLCLQGKELLYSYCKERNIYFNRCGKLILSPKKSQDAILDKIEDQAKKNNLMDLIRLSSKEVKRMEPEIVCSSAVLSPSSGYFDSYQFMKSLKADIDDSNGSFSFNSEVIGGAIKNNYIDLMINSCGKVINLRTKKLINAAGLEATSVINKIKNFPNNKIPKIFYVKGTYFGYSGKNPFKKLIYPLPEKSGLGIHITIDRYSKIKFGPDTELVKKVDYKLNNDKLDFFYKSINNYWPKVVKENIFPAYCGVRPKLNRENTKENDFIIQCQRVHQIPGLINLFGIESPGLTSSLAIGKYIRSLLI
jgi:L-2-hydroxyglutarate oxidase LhgO|tara:strand:+ start:4300 stop:5406 length:1107 start_codon:yes stop_codon:yes gene_type:complete